MFHTGQAIGNYTLIRKLGRGGFGEVWMAEHRTKYATTQVAVKLPLDEQVDHAAIEHEARLWAKASGHSNILPIIEANEYDGQVVIVSEYAPDGSLEEWLRVNGKMPVEKAAKVTMQILDGLEFLHLKNIIHRDLKPANILLQGNTPRLADFGISRVLRTTSASRSQYISGTLAYMSPEALDGKRSVQTDVWSVGVNLYEFLTGMLPFPQKEATALITAIAARDFAPLPDFVPDGLQKIVWNALIKSPENRYVSADAIREDLQHYVSGNSGNIMRFPAHQVSPTEPSLPIKSPETVKDVSIDTSVREDDINRDAADLIPSDVGFITPPKRDPPPTPPNKIRNWLIGSAAVLALGTAFVAVKTRDENNQKNVPIVTPSPPIKTVVSPKTLTAADYFNRAYDCADKKDYDCAVENYTQSINLDSSNPATYNNRGSAYVNKGSYDLAIADYNKAIELKPDDADSYYGRGIAYDDKGDYDRAIADYSKAIEFNSSDASFYYDRGVSYKKKGLLDLAMADYNKAIELKPDFSYPYNGRGNIYFERGDYDRAIADYRKALIIDPNYKKASDNLDNALKKQEIKNALEVNKR